MSYEANKFKEARELWLFGDDLDGDQELVAAALHIAYRVMETGWIAGVLEQAVSESTNLRMVADWNEEKRQVVEAALRIAFGRETLVRQALAVM